jgi:Ice-binding-like
MSRQPNNQKKTFMKNTSAIKNKTLNVRGLIVGLAVAVSFLHPDATAAQAPVALGSATTFAVLAATTVTTIPTTTVNGDLGVSPGNTATGSPIVNGTMHLGDPTAAQAQLDLTTAYNDAAGRTVGAVTVAGNLGGQTLVPGLYKSATSLEISSGDLTLDAQGDTNAVFIFQMGSTLITTVGRQVILSGGAQAANIFWQVGSSATIGGSSVFKGTIMADQSITMNTSATLEGRALARNGAVALDANTITIPNTVTAAVILVSAALVAGPYAGATEQSVNLATKTITVPRPVSTQFYRILAGTALTLTSITLSGGNVVITYN